MSKLTASGGLQGIGHRSPPPCCSAFPPSFAGSSACAGFVPANKRRWPRTAMVATNAFGLGIDKADIRLGWRTLLQAFEEPLPFEGTRCHRRDNCRRMAAHEHEQQDCIVVGADVRRHAPCTSRRSARP